MKMILATAAATLIAGSAFAGISLPPQPIYGPAFYAGLSWSFGNGGGTAGVSLKYLSTNEPEMIAGVAGATYYFDGTFGCDIGAGYTIDSFTATAGYDICKSAPQISLGIAQDLGTELVK